MLPNMVSSIVTFFAMQAYGRVPAMLNFSTGSKNIISACQTATIKTIYTSRRFIENAKLQEIIESLQEIKVKIIYLEDLATNITLTNKIKYKYKKIYLEIQCNFLAFLENVLIQSDPFLAFALTDIF